MWNLERALHMEMMAVFSSRVVVMLPGAHLDYC